MNTIHVINKSSLSTYQNDQLSVLRIRVLSSQRLVLVLRVPILVELCLKGFGQQMHSINSFDDILDKIMVEY